MATFPADSWTPTFPPPGPAHWVAFAHRPDGCEVLSDRPLLGQERLELADWLARYAPREPEAEASYIYIGMAEAWSPLAPDGQTSKGGVTGVGSGVGMGEPGRAVASTVAQLCSLAVEALVAQQ